MLLMVLIVNHTRLKKKHKQINQSFIVRINILIVFFLIVQYCHGLKPYSPPLLPLSPFPVVTGDQLKDYATEVLSVISEATLPTSTDELLAILVSESTAGFTGGIASRAVSFMIGDLRRDNSLLSGTESGAYFGIRGLVRSLSAIVGIPSTFANIIADVSASIFAEEIKFAARKSMDSEENKANNESLEMPHNTSTSLTEKDIFIPGFEIGSLRNYQEVEYKLIEESNQQSKQDSNQTNQVKNKSPIPIPEIMQDITKWVTYDLILPAQDSDVVPIFDAVIFGIISGMVGQMVFEIFQAKELIDLLSEPMDYLEKSEKFRSKILPVLLRFLQSGIEGGTLFASYESSIQFFQTSTAPEIRSFLLKKFSDFNFDVHLLTMKQ